ncbi:hypothetical protein POTOM_042337 [Populus tomentosa]|uniref:FHA domain-containing protein n=1 Tax=Populus tomentosa TaxID=118781 RepID=A0A8X8CHA7_POPTO|nr:hypothetical protein POTOM_042337 [Populus tomentosa]
MKDSILPSNKKRTIERKENENLSSKPPILLKKPKQIAKSALIRLQTFNFPLISPVTGSPISSISLVPYRLYTIGRTGDFQFKNRCVSKQHCQILFDSYKRKIYIHDGVLLSKTVDNSGNDCVVSEFRRRLICCDDNELESERINEGLSFSVSLNGVFVNGVRVKKGTVRELCAGDEVVLVCGNEGNCSLGGRIGFLIKGVAFKEEVVTGPNEVRVERDWLFESIGQSQGLVSSGSGNKRVFAIRGDEIMVSDFDFQGRKCGGAIERSRFLLSQCRDVLRSDEPISYIMQCNLLDFEMDVPSVCIDKSNYSLDVAVSDRSKFPVQREKVVSGGVPLVRDEVQHHNLQIDQDIHTDRAKNERYHVCAGGGHLYQKDVSTVSFESFVAKNACKTSSSNTMGNESAPGANSFIQMNTWKNCCPPPGKKFYLNRLQFMDRGSFTHPNVISLPELLYPVESISRIFIATFTSDILWFLSHCEIPCHLPVTIACHNTERCWSSSPDNRTSVPYLDFPNLVVVFPPFPESIAFGQDRKRQGIACHHPKLLVLQREDSIRVIITSANLVSNQWNNVTNTVWWQDFPARSAPDPSPLFIRISDGDANKDSRSDFAAQLAGFMASLVINVPSQAYWISELTKYNFEGANGHLVASVPGIHSCRSPNAYQLPSGSSGVQFLGSVEASVVGLSHLFHTAADRNGTQLKQLAAFLGKCCENVYGMSEIVLRRNLNVPADVNAVSILVPNPDQFYEGGILFLNVLDPVLAFSQLGLFFHPYSHCVHACCSLWFDSVSFPNNMWNSFSCPMYFEDTNCIQLGFLPRNVAKWVSPLWDSGFFRFSGYVYPKEALAAALGGSNRKGPCFPNMMSLMRTEHVLAFSSLVASIQRCTGIWRLGEVLGQYKWPDSRQSDFIYGSSSIGSVNAQFLAAFSAAAGKRSQELFDSEESDPEWGCWSASQELRNPSIKIIFPTIERVKNACNGILPSRRILCFSEVQWPFGLASNYVVTCGYSICYTVIPFKTWQRLRSVGILHDAIPHPYDRVGQPMHVKVARRRFQSKTNASSFGWVYCGSHNFSAAAWGRLISNPFGLKSKETGKTNTYSSSRLHVSNYELGIIFTFPPTETNGITNKDCTNLDDIVLPFAVPAPKYGLTDRPATARAMSEAVAELAGLERERLIAEEMIEEIPDEEEEAVEATDYAAVEKEEEKAYAEMLWNQVDSSQSF